MVEVASVFLIFLVKRRHVSFLQHIKHTAVYGKGSGRVSVKQLDTQLLETSKTTTKKQQEQQKPVCVCVRVCLCVSAWLWKKMRGSLMQSKTKNNKQKNNKQLLRSRFKSNILIQMNVTEHHLSSQKWKLVVVIGKFLTLALPEYCFEPH